MNQSSSILDLIDNFPGWQRAAAFLEEEIDSRQLRLIADVGGGAHPLLSEDFVRTHQLEYHVLDVSRDELEKAPTYCRKIEVDVASPPEEFLAKVGRNKYDPMFSHMLFEHLRDPAQAHRNIHFALRPAGIAIHMYPSPNNLPLALNRALPDGLTERLVRLAQPERDLSGIQGKFRAYYRMCGNPSRTLHARFEQLGFRVVRHTGFIGHGYYSRFPILRDLELKLRRVLLGARLPFTSAMLLILEKQ